MGRRFRVLGSGVVRVIRRYRYQKDQRSWVAQVEEPRAQVREAELAREPWGQAQEQRVPGQLGTGAWEIPRRMKNPSISWVALKVWLVSQPPPLSEGVEECPPEEREAEWAVAVERVERRFRPAGRSSSLGWLGLQ